MRRSAGYNMADENVTEMGRLLRGAHVENQNTAAAPKKLVLFDIDGTLSGSGMFSASLEKAAGEVLGTELVQQARDARAKVGKFYVDVPTMFDLADVPEGKRKEISDKIAALTEKYFKEALIEKPLKPLDGAAELLKQLSGREDIIIGVVTQNSAPIMHIKLASSGLDVFFKRDGLFGHGDKSEDKTGALEAVILAAEKKFGVKIEKSNTFYVGDQTNDVTAAKNAGIVAVAVATGRSSLAELSVTRADLVLDNLTDTKAVIAFIDGTKTPQKLKTV